MATDRVEYQTQEPLHELATDPKGSLVQRQEANVETEETIRMPLRSEL